MRLLNVSPVSCYNKVLEQPVSIRNQAQLKKKKKGQFQSMGTSEYY